MTSLFIPLSVPNIGNNEMDYTNNALSAAWVSTGGSYINEFEQNICQYVHVENAVACQSGTAGLHLALLSCGVTAEHEVIVPTLTFVATVNPVKYVGAEPIFMDCDDTLCMDMDKLQHFISKECVFIENKLINRSTKKQIKAVIVVHIFGNLADMEKLMEIAATYNLLIIEDATEALGSHYQTGKYAGKFAGTIGDVGVYSFNGNKIITTGGGGMIVSNNEEICRRCKYLSTQAKDDELYYIHNSIGYNYRMTNVQAAIGLAQLEQLESFIETKRNNYFLYQEKGLSLLPFCSNIRPNYWFYSYLTENRDELIEYLASHNIQTRPVWHLIHQLKPYKSAQAYCIEKAIYYWNRIVNIPCSSNLTSEEVSIVADKIKKYSEL